MSDGLQVTPQAVAEGGAALAAAAEPVILAATKVVEAVSLLVAPPGPGGGIGGMATHFAEVIARACADLSVDAAGHGDAVATAASIYTATESRAVDRFRTSGPLTGHHAI